MNQQWKRINVMKIIVTNMKHVCVFSDSVSNAEHVPIIYGKFLKPTILLMFLVALTGPYALCHSLLKDSPFSPFTLVSWFLRHFSFLLSPRACSVILYIEPVVIFVSILVIQYVDLCLLQMAYLTFFVASYFGTPMQFIFRAWMEPKLQV